MSYPRVERITNDIVDEYILKFYTRNQSIEFNKDLCTGCSICVKACPKGVIAQNHHGKIRVKTEDLFPEITDPTMCSYCGTCVYMCPFSAITLKKDGIPVKIDDIPIVKEKVVPKLEYINYTSKKKKKNVKIFSEGKVNVNWNLCNSCMSCYEVCPNRAYFKAERTNKLGKAIKLDINIRAACLYCGTCETSCHRKAIKLNIDKINYSGEYKEIFWLDLLNRIQG